MILTGFPLYNKERRRLPAFFLSVFFVADIRRLVGIERQIADRCDQTVDAERNKRKEEICKRSWRETFGFQRRVIDDYTPYPSQEESQ